MDENDTLSLRENLVNWLFTPLYLLLLFTMVTGYVMALKLSNDPYDRALTERARLLASRYDSHPGAVPLHELLPESEEALYFALYGPDGALLLTNASLPRPYPTELASAAPRLRDASLEGRKIRLLTLRFRSLRRDPGTTYVLQVAEPVEGRLALSRSLLANIVIPQFLFIVIAGIAVWIGLRRGLGPLERLRREMAHRPSDDLRPLDESLAPAEVRPLIREVNALIERLQGAMAQQRRFVADAAHQLRTPFAGLRAQAELALREEAPAPVHAALQRIHQGAARCSHLVNQLLTLARNEPGSANGSPFSLLDLNRIAQEAALHWAPEAVRQGIDMGFEGAALRLPVRGDEAALRDLLDNLLDNAIRYTPAGGHVTLRVGYEEGAWLRVEDDGPGIAPELRQKVFDRFYRPPGSSQPGSGLGLAIVREVARRHAARIDLGEGPGGRGAAFTVRFPHHGAAGA